MHRHGIRDHKPREAQLAAKIIADHCSGKACGRQIAGDVRRGDMPDHNGGARQIVRAVGDPLARGKLVVRFIRHGKTVVAVLGGVSVTGEMLVYRQNAL